MGYRRMPSRITAKNLLQNQFSNLSGIRLPTMLSCVKPERRCCRPWVEPYLNALSLKSQTFTCTRGCECN